MESPSHMGLLAFWSFAVAVNEGVCFTVAVPAPILVTLGQTGALQTFIPTTIYGMVKGVVLLVPAVN